MHANSGESNQRCSSDLAHLRSEGYVIVRRAIEPSLLKQVNTDLDPHFSQYPFGEGFFYGEKTVRFGGLLTKSNAAASLVLHDFAIAMSEQFLLPHCERFQLNLTQAIAIHPGESAQLVHRDDSMFPFPKPAGAHFMLNAMWALGEFTEENGATRLWPGTHLNDSDPMVYCKHREPVYAEMEPGDLLIYLGSTIHAGGANVSETEVRKGLVISYCLGWLRQSENQYLNYPPEVARQFSPALQSLIGYTAHRPNLGWYEGREPMEILAEQPRSETRRATTDLMPPEIVALSEALESEKTSG